MKWILPVLLSAFLYTAKVTIATEDFIPEGDTLIFEPERLDEPRIGEIFIQKLLHDYLEDHLEGFHIPAIPTINITEGEIDILLSLTDLNLHNISNVKVPAFTHDGSSDSGNQTFELVFPYISLDVGVYNAAGKAVSMPFNGEGPLRIALYDLRAKITFDWESYEMGIITSCAMENSTNFELDLKRFQVQFDNLNEGTDQGQLINIVLSSFGTDIVAKLQQILNANPNVDTLLINLLNKNLQCETTFETDHHIKFKTLLKQIIRELLKPFHIYI